MIYISHRGYIDGPDKKLENNPENITFLLKKMSMLKLMQGFTKIFFF